MNAQGRKTGRRTANSLRIEAVDNWDRRWPAVLASIARSGNAGKLRIDRDGWLSARQIVMVAFVGADVAAHVVFHVAPSPGNCVEAQIDSYGIERAFGGRDIERQLRLAAATRARALNCLRLVGFDLPGFWR